MNPCNCASKGPVVIEPEDEGWVRVVCCYCWRKTKLYGSSEAAIAAWNSGKITKA